MRKERYVPVCSGAAYRSVRRIFYGESRRELSVWKRNPVSCHKSFDFGDFCNIYVTGS